jgi:hypothetical protein
MIRYPDRGDHDWEDQRTIDTPLGKTFTEDRESNGPIKNVPKNKSFHFNKKQVAIGLQCCYWVSSGPCDGKALREAMARQQETPFDNIEGALEYVGCLLAASREARRHIETEIARASNSQLARKKRALQLVKYKLATLDFHLVKSERLLNDLRKLRRLILEEKEARVSSVTA